MSIKSVKQSAKSMIRGRKAANAAKVGKRNSCSAMQQDRSSKDDMQGGRFSTFLVPRRDGDSEKERPRTVTRARHSVITKQHPCGTFFQEARPVSGTQYFPVHPEAKACVVICLYNEVGPDLERTIQSLANSACTLNVCVVADGLPKISGSMKQYLQQKFKLTDPALLKDGPPWGHNDQIFVSHPVTRGEHGSKFSVLLKRHNMKKINSHEWFFRAHAPNSGCKFALCTDTGAIFRPGTIVKMITYMEENDDVVGVTGRQRVMSEYNQRVLGQDEPEQDDFFERCMRLLQGFDFEIDHTGGKASSCSAGLLPCLHGPCAFFRYDTIRGQCLDEYFDEWGYAPPHTLRLIGANLQLAEDRIPSLLGVLYSPGMRNDSTFDAVFEFEAELSLRAFITQRRRWINGTFAGLVYALTQAPSMFRSKEHSLAWKIANVLLLSLQALGFITTFFTPALFGFLFSSSVGLICLYTVPAFAAYAQILNTTIYALLYVTWVYVHLKRTDSSDCVLHPTLTKVVIGYNVVNAALVFIALILDTGINGGWLVMLSYASVPALPLLGALIGGDREGAILMIKGFPVFALASPAFVGFLSAYSAARIADLTWGNRPTTTADEVKARRNSLGAQGDKESETDKLNRWIAQQANLIGYFNVLLVSVNLVMMIAGSEITRGLAWLPKPQETNSWQDRLDSLNGTTLLGKSIGVLQDPPPWAGPFEGAIELYLLFSFPYLFQQFIGLFFHTQRTFWKIVTACVNSCSRVCAGGSSDKALNKIRGGGGEHTLELEYLEGGGSGGVPAGWGGSYGVASHLGGDQLGAMPAPGTAPPRVPKPPLATVPSGVTVFSGSSTESVEAAQRSLLSGGSAGGLVASRI